MIKYKTIVLITTEYYIQLNNNKPENQGKTNGFLEDKPPEKTHRKKKGKYLNKAIPLKDSEKF